MRKNYIILSLILLMFGMHAMMHNGKLPKIDTAPAPSLRDALVELHAVAGELRTAAGELRAAVRDLPTAVKVVVHEELASIEREKEAKRTKEKIAELEAQVKESLPKTPIAMYIHQYKDIIGAEAASQFMRRLATATSIEEFIKLKTEVTNIVTRSPKKKETFPFIYNHNQSKK